MAYFLKKHSNFDSEIAYFFSQPLTFIDKNVRNIQKDVRLPLHAFDINGHIDSFSSFHNLSILFSLLVSTLGFVLQ